MRKGARHHGRYHAGSRHNRDRSSGANSQHVGDRGPGSGLYDPDRRLRHLRHRVRGNGRRGSHVLPVRPRGHDVHGDQLRPHDTSIPFGGLGIHIYIRDNEPESRVPHRLGSASGLFAPAAGQRPHHPQLHVLVLPQRPGVDLGRGLCRPDHHDVSGEYDEHVPREHGSGRVRGGPDRSLPDPGCKGPHGWNGQRHHPLSRPRLA